MRTRNLNTRLDRLEKRFSTLGTVAPDDFEDAVRTGKIRRRHLDKLFREHGQELTYYLGGLALQWRPEREEKGSRTVNSLSGYNLAVDVLSYPPEESLEDSCIDLLKTAASYPLHASG